MQLSAVTLCLLIGFFLVLLVRFIVIVIIVNKRGAVHLLIGVGSAEANVGKERSRLGLRTTRLLLLLGIAFSNIDVGADPGLVIVLVGLIEADVGRPALERRCRVLLLQNAIGIVIVRSSSIIIVVMAIVHQAAAVVAAGAVAVRVSVVVVAVGCGVGGGICVVVVIVVGLLLLLGFGLLVGASIAAALDAPKTGSEGGEAGFHHGCLLLRLGLTVTLVDSKKRCARIPKDVLELQNACCGLPLYLLTYCPHVGERKQPN